MDRAIIDLISAPRLARYGDINDEATLEKYIFNIQLCESLYPALNLFEVVLRNKIDNVLSRHLGPNWLVELVQRDKYLIDMHRIYDKNELIDRLTLAFWHQLFLPSSREIIWSRCPGALMEIFEKRKKCLTLGKIAFEIDQIRRCRNALSHHGSMVMTTQQMNCQCVHDLAMRMIKEMGGKPVLRHIKPINRFNAVVQSGRDLRYINY